MAARFSDGPNHKAPLPLFVVDVGSLLYVKEAAAVITEVSAIVTLPVLLDLAFVMISKDLEDGSTPRLWIVIEDEKRPKWQRFDP